MDDTIYKVSPFDFPEIADYFEWLDGIKKSETDETDEAISHDENRHSHHTNPCPDGDGAR